MSVPQITAATAGAGSTTSPAIAAQATADPVAAISDSDAPRGWLGVELEALGTGEAGVGVAHIVPHSPAEAAGLAAGDVIVRLDNDAVSTPSDVVAAVSARHAGVKVAVMVKRAGADRLVAVTLGVFPEETALMRMNFVDRPAPPFEALETAKGSLTPTLASLRGQVVVVEFWASWCVACRAMIPHMNEWHEKYAARGLRIIGITNDPVARAATAASDLGMEYAVASDETGKTSSAYQAHAIPLVFVIDRAGTVRDVMIGYDADRFPSMDDLLRRLLAQS